MLLKAKERGSTLAEMIVDGEELEWVLNGLLLPRAVTEPPISTFIAGERDAAAKELGQKFDWPDTPEFQALAMQVLESCTKGHKERLDKQQAMLKYKARFPFTRELMRHAADFVESGNEAAALEYAEQAQRYDEFIAERGLTGGKVSAAQRQVF